MFNFPTTPNEAGKGKLITFVPLKSGVGASTLACYTALSFSSFQEVNLIDFNSESKVRSYLGFPPDISSTSVLDIKMANTPDMIYSASEKFNNINIFPGVLPKVMDIINLDTALLIKAGSYLKRISDVNIAVSGLLHDYSWHLPQISDLIFVVVKPDRTSQDSFREYIDFLARLGCQDRVKIILNQEGMPGGINNTDVFFTPDIILPYNVDIIKQCNRRDLKPDKKIKDQLIKIIQDSFDRKGADTDG